MSRAFTAAASDDQILPRIELGRRIESGFEWVDEHWGEFFQSVKETINGWVEWISARLSVDENFYLGLSVGAILTLLLAIGGVTLLLRGLVWPAVVAFVGTLAVLGIGVAGEISFLDERVQIFVQGATAPAIVLALIAVHAGLKSRYPLSMVAAAVMVGVFFVPAADYPLSMTVTGAILAWWAGSFLLGVGAWLLLAFVITMDQWENGMLMLAMVLLATVIALIIGIPIGILAAKSNRVSRVVRPVLDLMQTMPAFVWLVPMVTLFSVGFAAGVVATVVFCLPPGVRLVELGIRQVDSEVVEAGQAFGASDLQVLRGVQLPLALPTIMAGVNQVILLALSMAVIAGFVGAPGLGQQVISSISNLDIALGFEAGLCVVALAIYLDRVTAAIGRPRARRTAQSTTVLARFGRREKGETAPDKVAQPDASTVSGASQEPSSQPGG